MPNAATLSVLTDAQFCEEGFFSFESSSDFLSLMSRNTNVTPRESCFEILDGSCALQIYGKEGLSLSLSEPALQQIVILRKHSL